MSSNNSFKSTSKNIFIKGARMHNLKNISVEIPRNRLVVITGVSGSGKSTLAFDTLYAEGQRRYVESLSSYARQFLDRMEKPDVDYIKGLSPAIAIEQKVTTATTRSTVGTLTEIYDYLRLLYARIGVTYSPVTGEVVKKFEVSDVVDELLKFEEGKKYQILAPFKYSEPALEDLLQKGINRILVDQKPKRLDQLLEDEQEIQGLKVAKDIWIVVDRSVIKKEEDSINRMADSIHQAFELSEGYCRIDFPGELSKDFNSRFEMDGMVFDIPSPQFFNFNSPYGACTKCEGFGNILGIDESLVIPDKNLSLYEGAIAPWKGETMSWWKDQFIQKADKIDFPIHAPIMDLTEKQFQQLWFGSPGILGVRQFFNDVESQTYKIQYRVLLSRYRGRTVCDECHGTRLRKETQYVKINDKHIGQTLMMTISELQDWMKGLEISEHDQKIASRILLEINNRLQFMIDVGLEYLSLNRFSNTLSGGESQRINLTRTLGSNLTGSLYILDEPSVGLHPQDTSRLIKVLKHLRDLGNTVIVVEHEEEIIRSSDYLIDIGPAAGRFGGEVVYAGHFNAKGQSSLTTQYLNGELEIPLPELRRKSSNYVKVIGARENNLKNIDVKIPLQALTVVTGVSGSGKSTLIKQIVYPALKNKLEDFSQKPGLHKDFIIPSKGISKVEMVDQNPIGRSSRSNPVTYIKAYDAIRELYAQQTLSKLRGYQPKHFSFNVDGGRCETCKGEGETVVEMQFLADIHLTCETCKGKRFKREVLEVHYKGKSIADILEMSVEESLEFFSEKKDLVQKLQPLFDVGLGYVQLGQSSSTLSGGEAQRVKLASFLQKGGNRLPVFFLFDEPTTGLHFHDINKLLTAFNALVEQGHTVVVVEHNLDVIKSADWIIDLGPTGGKDGGYLLYEGAPEGIILEEKSITGKFLKEKL
ncbi:MAG TPA: excinuclease ABC subunit UvrA [Chitinophagales bacterium]|nr:excinuclease ABC subunit UvrA [Chitinophagales bacterium]